MAQGEVIDEIEVIATDVEKHAENGSVNLLFIIPNFF